MATGAAASAYAAFDTSGKMSPFSFSCRAVGDDDVAIKITHCGMCHSDVHSVRNEWSNATYPLIPGHEIVGVVSSVGKSVTKFKSGDRVGVSVLVRSCKSCNACSRNEEVYCPKKVLTYNAKDWGAGDAFTFGGYASAVIVDKDFVLRIPDNLPSDGVAPLLCAGITVYSPMIYYGMTEPGKSLGVVGLGGLGHMAVKFGKALGLKVTVLSTSTSKKDDALKVLGADNFVISKDPEQMKAIAGTLDYVISTLSVKHEISDYLNLLGVNGKLVLVGAPPDKLEFTSFGLISGRKMIGGSLVGGVKETQDMLDFCSKHNIVSMIERIPIQDVNTAMDRMVKNDVKYRFVIEVEKSLGQQGGEETTGVSAI